MPTSAAAAPAGLARLRGDRAAHALAALLGVAGATHLGVPRVYDSLIPPWLGPPRPWVLGSGVAELGCALAVAVPSTRRAGALCAAALFVVVFPGNVQMALDSRRGAASWNRRSVVAWARLPLQVPLVLWAWRVAAGARQHAGRPLP